MTVWSYSSLTAFETCPRRYQVVRILKLIKEEETVATRHGNEVHKALELYGRDGTALPEKYASYQPMMDAILRAPGEKHFEVKFALTENLQPTDFFAPNCWVRGVLDVQIINGEKAVVVDHKTGKPKNDPSQLKLFAAATFAQHPTTQAVTTGYAWLAFNLLDRETYTRAQADAIWAGFRSRVSRLDQALEYDEFPPKPSGLCRQWCPVPKRICEFSGRN